MSGEEVEVRVRENGRVVATIQRPLRELDGKPAITYRKQLWLLNGNSIEIGAAMSGPPLRPPQLSADAEEMFKREVPVRAEPPPPLPPETEDLGEGAPTWQDDPVAEPPAARLIVDAGPGTGKTHAACARVAAMVNSGIPASRICLVSFTRTAVVEIRSRIARTLEEPGDAASVRVITLDAFAWAVHSGFMKEARLTGSYEDNINVALQLLRKDQDVRDDLARIEHLIVDEAQDIVGPRADLILAMVDGLSPESGITVFADRAQAIYAFAEGEDDSNGTNLLDALTARGFRQMQLTEVHRTSDPNLLAIFTKLRRDLLSGRKANLEKHVKSEIRRLAHADAGEVAKLKLDALPHDALVLMRNRLDVLIASSRAGLLPHRLRLSGMPVCVRGWVAQLLWDYTQRRITRDSFEKRWHARDIQAPFDCAEAWSRCVEVAGDSVHVVDLHSLRKVLARTNPPMQFCTPEFGTAGPILGTIHASKGREAPTVYLYLQETAAADETGEESRIMFVGATRPRDRLLVGTTGGPGGNKMNGRVWRRTGISIEVEVGRPHDIEPSGLVGRTFFARQEDARVAQEAWASQPRRLRLMLRAESTLGWQFTINDGEQRLGGLSDRFRGDIEKIAWRLNKSITWLAYGRSIGLRTMVVAPDSPHLETMLEPWKSSGFLYAPLLTSFSHSKPKSR
ncbi:UvrD-helicase domain-containing protein [Xanthomonas melonis]|uniref:UvrD-like helicase ATP-binding domain-containing protein n=1 Tax=Xanthomonas melonis TaxID=56456 RepID=A0A2S7DD91_9XANT|nr:UvrD-helicase domain-containing protein [Xanthomonas melonis]MCC4601209.1 UvrD-helicase domain-containing protein [Xanthomonas melonis]PPU71767.1 hypothetical protein XmelCFBP4644_14020 [Xanthomonas melonis]